MVTMRLPLPISLWNNFYAIMIWEAPNMDSMIFNTFFPRISPKDGYLHIDNSYLVVGFYTYNSVEFRKRYKLVEKTFDKLTAKYIYELAQLC